MKIKVSNYISNFFVEKGVTDVFTVVGGGAMHLNDAFGHQEGLNCTYNHNEQASAMAAESYARINNKIAVVCVTNGPAGTNAMTGVLGGFVDSIPMIIISGQVRYDTTVRSTGLSLRAMGDQEFDICSSVASMTKYAEMIIDPLKIRYCLEKAFYECQHDRPGPCWLDIPLNVQGALIEADNLSGYNSTEFDKQLPPKITKNQVDAILSKLKNAKRPVIFAGNGVRISGGYDVFRKVIEKLNIPVVTTRNALDLIEKSHPLCVGVSGINGDRAGNFAVQNSDVLFTIGNRLNIRSVGYNHPSWARESFVIANDIDENELKKPTVHIEMPIWADAKDLLQGLDDALPKGKFFNNAEWLECTQNWKINYPVVQKKHLNQVGKVNFYAFIHNLSLNLSDDEIVVLSVGSAAFAGSQSVRNKKNQRFILSYGADSMGYDLPAAIGASVAAEKKDVVLITSDGSFMMNLQELETISYNKLPIKIFLINNEGYHTIRQTQSNFFQNSFVGVGKDSGVGFPEFEKIAAAFDLPYYKINNNQKLSQELPEIYNAKAPFIAEIFVDTKQVFEPKAVAKKLPDGSMVSATLENMSPFLSEEELMNNLYVKPFSESQGGGIYNP